MQWRKSHEQFCPSHSARKPIVGSRFRVDKTLLAQAARARHMNVSQFVLEVSLDAARTILADQTEFRLPPEQWKAFCQRLDAPPQVIPELRRLFSEADPFHG